MSDDNERISKKVIIEQSGSSSSGNITPILIGVGVIVAAIVIYILMHVS